MLTTSGRQGDPDTVRRLSAPQSVRVEADTFGTPRRVFHRGLWRVVAQVKERWRTEDRWWTEEPISREYFELLLENGRLTSLYFDRLRLRWSIHAGA